MREASIERSFLGSIGRSLEPVTQFAGFDWKINIALLSSFAARESSVATLGVLFQQDDDENVTLESRMESENQSKGGTALLAVSMILFFALYPPCLATTVMVRMQTGSYKWMAFSIIFPTILGLVVSSLVFTIGTALQTRAIVAMSVVYWGALALLLAIGLGEEWWQRRKLRQNAIATANASPNTTGKA
jgi:ferrous iron transport protein B